MKPSLERPVVLRYADYDGNGSVDPKLFYYIQGKSFPFASRDELIVQLPMLKRVLLIISLTYQPYLKRYSQMRNNKNQKN
tara:strand:+ start:51 stop:290 length:240 start_codon:yes stop_codon:yes gene_type:complete